MMASHAVAQKLFARHQQWALSVAGAALRRIGPQADGEEIRQVAQVATWERALAFNPRLWTVKPAGNPFQIYAYPSVYGACLMVGLRGSTGRAKTANGKWVGLVSTDSTEAPKGLIEGGEGKYYSRIGLSPSETPVSGPNQCSVDTAIDASTRRELIVAILHELPKRERYLIAEHYLGGVSLSAIAESLFTSPSSVSRIHANALNLLRVAVARRGMKAGEWL